MRIANGCPIEIVLQDIETVYGNKEYLIIKELHKVKMAFLKIITDNEKLNSMIEAGIESIRWRQDRYDTGGIVESDERVDEGRKLYWP